MTNSSLSIRRSTLDDLAAVDRLLARSYPRLLAADYPPSTLVLVLPRITRARPELLTSGTYFLAEDVAGRLLSAGGWTPNTPSAAAQGAQPGLVQNTGHVRHVATDPDALRQGIGRALMAVVMQDARDAGMQRLECLSTRTAVPFYSALGFHSRLETVVELAPGIRFPVVQMLSDLGRSPVV